MTDLMIDLETLGTDPNSVVVSIGAVMFSIAQGKILNEFYAVLDLQEQLDRGRSISADTLKWWFRQSPDAQKVFASKYADTKKVLSALSTFCKRESGVVVWGNGAAFDITIMQSLYKDFGMLVPWAFWNVNDLRTFTRFVADGRKFQVKKGTKHNALADAKAQTLYVLDELDKKRAKNA